MTKEQTFLVDNLLADLLQIIIKDRRVNMQAALDVLYNSKLYTKINDFETGLFIQSADYNYELLKEELNS